jgi:hypothetical protein
MLFFPEPQNLRIDGFVRGVTCFSQKQHSMAFFPKMNVSPNLNSDR